jgi:two-component system response regulator (stage 0 sporulation protein A)
MKIRLLIIEDDELLVGMIIEYFQNNSNIDVALVANDGNEGINTIDKHLNDFDIILLDIIMPYKDGIDVLNYVQNNKVDKKIIVVTSFNTPDMIHKVATLGASYYLMKPFELKKLEKIIIQLGKRINYKHKIIDLTDYKIQISITNTLHELGVPSHIKGYQYIFEGIIVCIEKESISFTKEIYPIIAKKYDSTISNVERSIRHAIEISWNRGNWEIMEEFFGNSIDMEKAKPTNKEFIITIADKLKLES